jgi:murein DD-endopeptidase MepM/ murein hydrolase activator NlpD
MNGRDVPTRRTASRLVAVTALVLASALASQLVSDAGARPPTSTVQVPATAFSRVNPAALDAAPWGDGGASVPGSAAPTVAPAPAPGVVRFRPRDGSTKVLPGAQLSVRFTVAMDHASTEAAFHATIGTSALAGTYRWAEGDTVIVLRPGRPMPYSAKVVLRVEATARSAVGIPVAAAASVTFTVEARPVAPTGGSSASTWQWPLIGPITQYFGDTLTQYGFHQGIDIDGDTGDPVKAARTGTVVVAGYADECGGLQVRIDHGNGVLSWYRHLSAVKTRVGARVSVGAIIGLVGATGCATGSHLHFGISTNGTFVDPLRYLPRL